MGIWIHRDTVATSTREDLDRTTCLFCKRPLQNWITGDELSPDAEVNVCLVCGWWSRTERYASPDLDEFNSDPSTLIVNERHSLEGACAQLKNLDLTDVSTPLAEVRRYLLAKEAARFTMHPRLLELTVASVFRDLGYSAAATAYHNDGGIDVILEHGKSTIGVQVKRYAARIEAEQIRSLAGALILGDHTEGVFVTTSTFRSGAKSAARRLTARGLPIKLMDGTRFLRQLGVQEVRRLTKGKVTEYVEQILLTGTSCVIYENQ